MKKFSFFLICAIVVFAISCEEKEKSQEFSVNGTKITNETTLTYDAVATEGSITLNFKSSDKWYTTIDNSASDWLSISPKSGLNSNIKITYRENDKMEERTGKIKIKADEISFYISVKQAAKPFVAFEFAKGVSFEKTVPHSTGEETFAFKANVENWTAKSSVDWLMVSPTEGEKGDQILTFAFAKNEGKVNREGKITVSSGDSSFVIKVKQAKNTEAFFEFEEGTNYSKNVPYTAGTETFTFKSNVVNWSAKSSQDWLTVTASPGGKGNQTLTIGFEHNENRTAREGIITVNSGEVSFTITVTQAKNTEPYFVFAAGTRFSKSVPYTEKTESLSFQSHVDNWTATSSKDWITVTPISGGKGDYTLTLNYALNETDVPRDGTITVSSGDTTFTIQVRQAPHPLNIFSCMDDNEFRKSCKVFDTNKSGFLSIAEARAVIIMRVNNNNINSMKGIEYFTNLEILDCTGNRLTVLDLSNNTALTHLDCTGNRLTVLDLSNNTALTYLNCWCNQLSSLDVSKNTQLTYLSCWDNKLSSLDVSKNTQLTYLNCYSNQLSSLDVNKNTQLTYLNCRYNQLSSLDVSKNTQLTYLSCTRNQLSSLDVSKNTKLDSLDCQKNQLTELGVNKNTALKILWCDFNQLSSLDVSKNTQLTYLTCWGNQLNSLDVSKNTALDVLVCNENHLSVLDVTNNIRLHSLDCRNNQLTVLDISKNTALTSLMCAGNKLSSLDVNKHTALIELMCYSNKLISLDVSKNTALKILWCYSNLLTELDVSNNTALTNLDCNPMTDNRGSNVLKTLYRKSGQYIQAFDKPSATEIVYK